MVVQRIKIKKNSIGLEKTWGGMETQKENLQN